MYMEESQLAEIKQKLETEKAQLEKELGGFATKNATSPGGYTSRFPSFGNDEGENAGEVSDYSDRLSLETTLEKQLKDVVKALKRIEDGTYGICVHCGKPIEVQRLLIRPTSTSCVDCKKKLKGE